MPLFAQFDKCVALSRRSSSFMDEKTGEKRNYKYLTGFNAVDGSVFTELIIDNSSSIQFEDVQENAVYDCIFVSSNIKGEKNATKLTSVKLEALVGFIEFKPSKK